MYSVPLPVSAIRTRIRQEYERHRYVNKLPVVDILIQKGNADYQVRRGNQIPDTLVCSGQALTEASVGDDELLAPNYTHHVLLQGGELPRGQATTDQLHDRFPRGMCLRYEIKNGAHATNTICRVATRLWVLDQLVSICK
jgi:hypothetical protein